MQRIAIVNRGEAATRFIISARELPGITTIALYSEADRRAMFVRDADESYALGAPEAYLDLDRLDEALRHTRADAAWVGWGFVAERPAFAELCAKLGVVFIGPRPEVMRRLGDKINAKRLAESVGVPVAAWSGAAVDSVDEAREHARRLGYPLLIKAAAGGDGRGICRVSAEPELAAAFDAARGEARRVFGDGRLFIEEYLRGARHVAVQIIGDQHGAVWALGTRDCTLQRRSQKLIEEAPASLPAEADFAIREAATDLARAAGYENAGTVEFLWQPQAGRAVFMEVNAHLQMEHAVTEVTTGVDLVKLQLHVAAGGHLIGPPPPTTGHAVEVRLCAEDPERGFAPAPGRLERFRMPRGAGVRVDSGYDRDDTVPAELDSMIAKIIGSGRTRDEALARLRRALEDCAVVLRGGATNKGFLLELLARPEVQRGEHELEWLDGVVATGAHVSRRGAAAAVVHAALEAYDAATAIDQQQFARSARRGRPVVPPTSDVAVELSLRGHDYAPRVRRVGPDRYDVSLDGVRLEVMLEPLGAGELRLRIGDQRFRVLSLTHGTTHLVEVDGIPHRVMREGAGLVRAIAPGMVVSVAVKPSDLVATGDRLVVLEAMKSYIDVGAEQSGRVREVLVVPNMQVAAGQPLLILEADGAAAQAAPAARLVFDALAGAPREGWRCALEDLRSLVLGYDVDATAVRKALQASAADAAPEHRDLEDDVLATFADLLSLFRRRAATTDEQEEATRSGATEHFYAYLRDLSGRGAGLPAAFLERLSRALARYGVVDRERSPELHESLFRICKARGRLEEQVGPLLAVLSRRIDAAPAEAQDAGDQQREILDRVISETRQILETVCDYARWVRYLYFERTLLDASRDRLFEEATARLAALAGLLPPEERRSHIEALAALPHPLLRYLSERLPTAGRTLRHALLQLVIARSYDLRAAEVRVVDGKIALGVGEHAFAGRPIRVIAAHEELVALPEALAAAAREAAAASSDVYLDLYLWDASGGESADSLLARLRAPALPPNVRGVVLALSSPQRVVHLTLRPGENGLEEQRHLRGLHPAVARRLQLWRLARFELERLPSPDEIFLFRARGRENRDDERLIALAEVRDITAVRDAAGHLVSVPHFERVLGETLAAMRLEQLRRPARERLYWNRVQLFVRPPVTLPSYELDSLVRRLAPATEGMGLERIIVRVRFPDGDGALIDRVIDLFNPGEGVTAVVRDPPTEPMETLSPYAQKVVRLRKQGLTSPYEIVAMLTARGGQGVADFPPGEFIEHDLDESGELVPVHRPPGENRANIVVGVIRNFVPLHPEGMARVILLGDPGKEMGSLAEPECRRINAALALATRLGVPVEWFALSAGAKIAIDSGTENMDWIALVLRRIIELTQRGGEINVIVDGINVGAQPYWNAEATMLMHTRGILVMTHQGAMVLTGKRALDYSGGVSADDNSGIGGYERIMGPNGQAQYLAADLAGACHTLFAHYAHTYVAPGERFPRRAPTTDPFDRDVLSIPHAEGLGFATVGEIFSDATNPGRKRPFDIRSVLIATIDQDHPPLERWFGQRGAENAVVWDAHLGGFPVCLLGIESRSLPRLGMVPADGPEQYTPGTLFPMASKKLARALNAASGNRPVVVLANLTGFDGSPESMRDLQLEFGAEIGRAVVNFRGPIVFLVISRYHGGAFVVFSAKLNDEMEVAALEGSYASVIGGAPAAAVVFAREVERRARRGPRVLAIDEELSRAEGPARAAMTAHRAERWKAVHSEMLGRVADEFDHVHSVQRAQEMGSVHRILDPRVMRPYLIDAIARGIARARR